MITFFLGIGFSVFAIVFATSHSGTAFANFINTEGLGIVIGGCISIFLTANRSRVIKSVAKLVWGQVFGSEIKKVKEVKETILRVSKSIEAGQRPGETGHELLNLGLSWIEAGLNEDQIDNLIIQYSKTKLSLMDEATNAVIHLGKYPPALGMVGTVFGIVGIFSSLGAEGAAETIGPSLAVAMTATLYGLVVANFIVQPMGELLAQSVDAESRVLNMCSEAIRLWHSKEAGFYIKEQMNLYEEAA